MSTKQQVAELAAKGLAPADIARQLNITTSYISQLLQDDEYKHMYNKLLAHQQVATHSTYAQIDENYNSLELKLSALLVENSDIVLGALIEKPGTLLAAIRTLNQVKRRAVGEGYQGDAVQNNQAVVLVMPTFIADASTPKVIHNSNNEVIEVDGRSLVSLSDTALKKQLSTAPLKAAFGKLASGNDGALSPEELIL
jgi:hypothetical protein